MSTQCFHCGQSTEKGKIASGEKSFCCLGCLSVYEILTANGLTDFYELNKNAGIRPTEDFSEFDYLDTPVVFEKLVDFSEGSFSLVNFKIPVIHCSSCIWLLENLKTLNSAIMYSTVNFTQKSVRISFHHKELKLSGLAKFLANLGYKPVINLETLDKKKEDKFDKDLLVKLAVAGFSFGNGMLFSFPEYLGNADFWLERYAPLFRFLMFLLSLPVVFYSALGYYRSAWYGVKNGRINIDIPIVVGIFALFGRSVYEILVGYGPGYFDTLCGLLFFMLLGKFFQQNTYKSLSYDRDYKSFYPIAVTRIKSGVRENILLSEIKVGDRILVRNGEIIPVDAILISGEANIDNSFITGESESLRKLKGERIFAGGKQKGPVLELEVIKDVDQSYLTQLWNKEPFQKGEKGFHSLTDSVSKYFSLVVLLIALASGVYWWGRDVEKMFQVICAILIVACPCALALSAPFTMGHVMRIMGRNKVYVKDALTIEKMAKVDTLVFDKTGTITHSDKSDIRFHGRKLSHTDERNLKSLVKNSNHPLSRLIDDFLAVEEGEAEVEAFHEVVGKGYEASVGGCAYRVGSASFIGIEEEVLETSVYVSKAGIFLGKFIVGNRYRSGLGGLFERLKSYRVHILSGDNPAEREKLEEKIPNFVSMRFHQSPEEKLEYIKLLQQGGEYVAMLGDGLNDSGALKQSDVGVAVADDTNSFTPSSNVIMSGERVCFLTDYLSLAKDAVRIVKITFVISLLYNVVGISFAATGNMSPLFAAIIMPMSSISVVVFTSLATWMRSRVYFKST